MADCTLSVHHTVTVCNKWTHGAQTADGEAKVDGSLQMHRGQLCSEKLGCCELISSCTINA